MNTIKNISFTLSLIIPALTFAQKALYNSDNALIKNVILLIPDGTSSDLLSLARWYNGNQPRAVDSIICGMVKTYNADNKFPDSAPTSTAYATGVKTNAPFIGIDTASSPLISVLEMARLKGLSTGIVVTSEFPHATPADFVCHYNSRESKNYANLTKQFIYNSPSLVFAGGKHFLESNQLTDQLIKRGYKLITSKEEFTNRKNDSVWALFPDYRGNTKFRSFECDRNEVTEPSLSEMTEKAIEILSQNPDGFFLMVEGSQIDWACHYNDPFAAVTEFIEFDNAVKKALEFAGKNNNTVVIVCPDHGNGGISIGNVRSNTSFNAVNPTKYDNIDINEDIIKPLKQNHDRRVSGRKMAEMIISNPLYARTDSISKYFNLSDTNIQARINNIGLLYPKDKLPDTIQYILGSSFSFQHFIGWTTTGHTAEDVFLGIYAPKGTERITGVVDNSDIGKYISSQLRMGNLNDSTKKYYCPYKKLFNSDEIKVVTQDSLVIIVNKQKMVFFANTNICKITKGKSTTQKQLPTLAVCFTSANKQVEYFIPEIVLSYTK